MGSGSDLPDPQGCCIAKGFTPLTLIPGQDDPWSGSIFTP